MAVGNAVQRDISKIDKTILDNFYKLVHSQPNVRLTAASSTFKILNALKKRQTESFNENLNYSVDRLVAGLSSSRALARRGYGTLLLEILNSFQVSTERLFSIALQKFGHISKETSRDNLIGYFLLISIVLNSGNYKRSKANNQYLEKVYKYLIQLQGTKSYLEYSVSKLLTEYYHVFHPFMEADIPQQAFGSDAKLSSIDFLIIMLCNKKEPIKSLIQLDTADLINLCSLMLENKFKKRPLHPIFAEASKFFINHRPQEFELFYSKILFPTFFKANHNELAAMGLELTSSLIESTDNVDAIKIMLNSHVLRTIIISMRSRNTLYIHCVKFFAKLKEHFAIIQNQTEKSESSVSDKQFAILNQLTISPGSIAFDEDSKSSSLNDLLHNSSSNVLKKYLDNLMLLLCNKSLNVETQHSCARQIAHIVRRPQIIDDQATMTKAAKFLLLNSLFKNSSPESKDPNEPLWKSQFIPGFSKPFDDKVRASFRNAYHTTLDHIVSVCNSDQRIEQLNELIDFSDRLLELDGIQYVGAIEAKENDKSKLKKLWSEFKSSLKNHMKLIKERDGKKQLYPITTLYLFYGLQIVEHELVCQRELEDLAKSSQEVLDADSEDGSWADILTELIVQILSATECSSWMRKLCESVFGSLLPHISQTSIDIVCDAIKAPLDNEENDSEVEDEEGSDDNDDMSDEHDTKDLQGGSQQDTDNDEDVIEMAVDDEDEEYLDDDQMMKLDSVLADMFKLNRDRKKPKDQAFRLRCLDLVKKVLMKKHNDTDLINRMLATVIPLATSSRKSTETRPVADKIIRMLTKMPGKNKHQKLVGFLEKLH